MGEKWIFHREKQAVIMETGCWRGIAVIEEIKDKDFRWAIQLGSFRPLLLFIELHSRNV